jgi:hypothetical protein
VTKPNSIRKPVRGMQRTKRCTRCSTTFCIVSTALFTVRNSQVSISLRCRHFCASLRHCNCPGTCLPFVHRRTPLLSLRFADSLELLRKRRAWWSAKSIAVLTIIIPSRRGRTPWRGRHLALCVGFGLAFTRRPEEATGGTVLRRRKVWMLGLKRRTRVFWSTKMWILEG